MMSSRDFEAVTRGEKRVARRLRKKLYNREVKSLWRGCVVEEFDQCGGAFSTEQHSRDGRRRCLWKRPKTDLLQCVQTASEGIQNLRSPNPTKEGEVEPELLVPHMWAYPYLTLSPDYCFVLLAEECGKEKVVGYILGTPDTNKFVDRINNEYVESQRTTRPWLSKDWVPPDEEGDRKVHVKWAGQEDAGKKARKLLAMLHYPADSLISNRYPDLVSAYPAHLHINILPEFVGKGYGRQLQETLWARLREDGIPGVHLECGEENDNAIAFYGHLGFVPWDFVMDGGVSGKKGIFKEKIAGGVASVSGLAMVKKL